MLSQPAAGLAQGLGQRDRRHDAGQLAPKLFGRQPQFQRFAVQFGNFGLRLLDRGPAVVELFAQSLHGLLPGR